MALNLKKILNFSSVALVGLDIGSSSVKMVRLQKDQQGYFASAAAMVDIDTQTEDQQQLKDNTIAAIRTCLETQNTRTRNAVCGLCGPDFFSWTRWSDCTGWTRIGPEMLPDSFPTYGLFNGPLKWR